SNTTGRPLNSASARLCWWESITSKDGAGLPTSASGLGGDPARASRGTATAQTAAARRLRLLVIATLLRNSLWARHSRSRWQPAACREPADGELWPPQRSDPPLEQLAQLTPIVARRAGQQASLRLAHHRAAGSQLRRSSGRELRLQHAPAVGMTLARDEPRGL